MRDLLIFQLKLVLDGLKDVVLIQVSLLAALYDLLFGRPGRPLLFYNLLRLSERVDRWLNLYGASRNAEDTDEGLFGASRAGAFSGLLAGAVLGQLIGLAWGRHADVLTLAGLLSGTLLAARFSKPRLPEPEILRAGTEQNSDPRGKTPP